MLSLIEPESRLWERFCEGRLGAAEIAEEPLLRHWQRARTLGVRADGPAPAEGIGYNELLDRRAREGGLVHSVSAVLGELQSELSRRNVLALLADRDGIILHTAGGGAFLSRAARTRLIEGACWSEGARGTNAIGTALFGERGVHVRGRAHFERVNHALFCYAAPIHDATGRLIGVLDLTGMVDDDQLEIGRLVRQIVYDVERRLSLPVESSRPWAGDPFEALWGDDPTLVAAKNKARLFAQAQVPVLLLGETGTGKELFARAVHAASPRKAEPFVAVNCGALAPDLITAELFGHAPSAFTGAARNGQIGKLEAAHGGTLFLDELAELDASGQAALLRVLEDGTFYRVGEPTPRSVDLRVVCATCQDLQEAVAQGRFRADLYFRLSAAPVTVPPLRKRTDRLELAMRLLGEVAGFARELDESVRSRIVEYEWPGNIRELKNALQHAALLAGPRSVLTLGDLPEAVARPGEPQAVRRDEVLASAAQEALLATGGNISRAAKRLGVARSTFYRMLRR